MKQREIKFRGKVSKGYNEDFFHQKFVYGNAIICEDSITSTIINKEFEAEVDTETIGQYTGIKDKNGREIYEGDIIHRHMNVYWEVRFTKDRWQAHPKYESGLWLDTDQFQESEVVGNIYENAGLMAVAPLTACR